MAAIDLALARLLPNEGFKPNIYTDSRGVPTIGYGTALKDWSQARAGAHALTDLQLSENEIAQHDWFLACDQVRQSVLIEMDYNLGLEHLLTFHKFLDACVATDWQTAHDEMLNSAWATQVGARANRLAQIMLTGAP